MATLIISYYGSAQNNCASQPIGSESVTTSGTSAQGSANSSGAAVASLYSDAAHYFTVGSDPTAAATNSGYLPASTLMWVDLNDTTDKIAAITA
jgi:hypothetical protein